VAWEFFPLDDSAFPAVRLARRAGTFARTAPAAFNAANEVCVEAFINGHLPFLGIVDTVTTVVEEHIAAPEAATGELSLAAVLGADTWARNRAQELISAVTTHG
jgi:1-deoxy-D-xylulose-5-phosphate reductoisomerase